MTEMLMVTRELTEVTLPDGSKAWFESQKAANSFASLMGKVRELFKDREALLGGFENGAANPKPKPQKKEAAAKVEKKPITAKKSTTPPPSMEKKPKRRSARQAILMGVRRVSLTTHGATSSRSGHAACAETSSRHGRDGRRFATRAESKGGRLAKARMAVAEAEAQSVMATATVARRRKMRSPNP